MVAIFDWILGIFIISCMLAIGWTLIRVPHEAEKNEEKAESGGYLDAIGVELPDETQWHIRRHKLKISHNELSRFHRSDLITLLRARFAGWYLGLRFDGFAVGNVVLQQWEDSDFQNTIFTAEAWCIKVPKGQTVKVVPGKNDGINFLNALDEILAGV